MKEIYKYITQNDIDRFCSYIITPDWINNSNNCWEMSLYKK
jgi:hypothetical protein